MSVIWKYGKFWYASHKEKSYSTQNHLVLVAKKTQLK